MITVADHGSVKSFILNGRIVVQAEQQASGALVPGFVDKALVPGWSDVPSWYPCEQAIADAIEKARTAVFARVG